MCGIAGSFGGGDREALVRGMTACLAHRGPDDVGAATLHGRQDRPAGAFGHRRLSILDLSPAGRQPMYDERSDLIITFNGEIYNFPALRQELIRRGQGFRSGTDTEVILAGFAEQGTVFLRSLRGMFALALWSRRQQRGWLARDRFGIKPLFISSAPDILLFASEVRALVRAGRVPPAISATGVDSYLLWGSASEPGSMVEGIEMLPAGHVLEVDVVDGRARAGVLRPFAEPAMTTSEERITEPKAISVLVRDALRDSVASHFVADVPVGAFLSGGVDSSAIVAVAAEVRDQPVDTFTVTFGEARFNEAVHAAEISRRFGTRHHEIPLSAEDLLASLPQAFAAMDQPSMDGLNTFVVSGAVRRQGITVALSGLGGDELFAGYPSFRRARLLDATWPFSRSVARRLSGLARAGSSDVRAAKLSLIASASTAASASYQASRALFGPAAIERLTGQRSTPALPPPPSGLTLLQEVSWFELTGYMRNTLLRDSDVFSMAHGLELRVPFIDPVVVAAAARADDALKLRRDAVKPVLVSSVSDLLPSSVWERPKQGFTLPFEDWMRTRLKEVIDAEFSADGAERIGLRSSAVRDTWRAFLRSPRSTGWSRPWALYTLIRWARENGVEIASSAVQRPAPQLIGESISS